MGQKSIIVNTPNKKNHSDAQDWAAIFNGLYGGSTGILPIGSKLVVGVNDEFAIINDGVFSLSGHMLRVKEGTRQFLKLPETEVGKKRIAYVVAQYVVNAKMEDDVLEFAILAGEPDAINPLPPQVTSGNIDKGDRLNQAILAELLIEGNKAEVNKYGKKAILLPYVSDKNDVLEKEYNGNTNILRFKNTNVYFTKIPKEKKMELGYFQEVESIEHIENSISINGGYFRGNEALGITIKDKKIISEKEFISSKYKTLVWNDGAIGVVDNSVSGKEILDMGYSNSIHIYDYGIKDDLKINHDSQEKAQRSAFGWDETNFYFISCEGRTYSNEGLTFNDVSDFGKDHKIKNLVFLDGGGSSQQKFYNLNLNSPSDSGFTEYRKIKTYLTFKYRPKETTPRFLGIENKINDIYRKVYSRDTNATSKNLNDEKKNEVLMAGSETKNKPANENGFVIVMNDINGEVKQLFIGKTSNNIYQRMYTPNSWGNWEASGSGKSPSTNNLNKSVVAGMYYVPFAAENKPDGVGGGWVSVSVNFDNGIMQIFYGMNNKVFTRFGTIIGGEITSKWASIVAA